MGTQYPRHEGPLCALSDVGRPDHRISGAWQANHRYRRAELRNHRSRLEGHAAGGVKEYKSPTSIVWLLGRIYCTGTPEDYAEVHKLQDECKLVPLSSYGKPYTPPAGTIDPSIDTKTAAREQVCR